MKRYSFFAAIILLLTSSVCLFGQKSTIEYDLSTYSLPNLKRQQLELTFDLDQTRNYRNTRSETDTTHGHYSDFNIDFAPSYYYYLNTKKVQIESSTSTNPLNLSYIRNYYYYSKTKSLNYSPFFNYSGEHRFYIKGKFFVEADLDAYFRYDFTKSANQMTIPEEKTNITDISNMISVPLLIGTGRIERVEDARLAVYILDDLKKHNKLDREVSQDEITVFAQFLSKLQNERFLDNREKKIKALQRIDSFMVANNLVNKSDVISISLVNDNWDFANLPARKSGFRISGGIENSLGNSFRKESYTNESNDNERTISEYGIHLIGSLVYEKPINLYLQFFINDRFITGPAFETTITKYNNSSTLKSNYFILRNSFNTGLGFYPNSRTDVSINYNISAGYAKAKNVSENAQNASDENYFTTLSTGIQLVANYYVSPKLRLSINTGFNHNFGNSEYENMSGNIKTRDNSGNIHASIGLIYKIF